jgi:signal transduction histidine kinase
MMQDIDAATSIALVACRNRHNAFLPRMVHDVYPSMPMLVYGTIEQIQSYKDMLDKLPKEPNYIKVPHSVQDLVKTLNIIADDEHVNTAHYSLSKNKNLLNESPTLHKSTDLTGLLDEIQKITHAAFVVIFQINLNSMETSVYDAVGRRINLTSFDRGHLQFSPISDAIIDKDFVYEERDCHQFKYLTPLGDFASFVGLKIGFEDENGYGLFIFGDKSTSFSHIDKGMFAFCELAVRAHIERKKMLERTSDEQKFILSGKLTSNFMHEIKNQIQALDYWLNILKTDSIDLNRERIKANDKQFLARFEQSIDGALGSAKRTRNIEELFLNLLRKDEKKSILLDNYLSEFIDTIKPLAKEKKIKIELDSRFHSEIKVNISSFNQILLNLLLNCFDFVPLVRKQTGVIKISAFKDKADKLPIKIRIADNGPGINERNREKVFDTLYTTKPNGSGLGLAISRRLAEAMGGQILIEKTMRLSGTTFLLELPRD